MEDAAYTAAGALRIVNDGPNWILAGHIVKVKGRKQELLHPVKFEFMA